MRVPMCAFETHDFQYQTCTGRWEHEAIAQIRPCGCAGLHTYQDFDERLKTQYPKLHLGFDRKNGRWVIYRWTPQIEHVKAGSSLPTLTHVKNYLDIVIDCKYADETPTKERGRRVTYTPRMYGQWIFAELARFDPRRMEPDMSWIGDYNLELHQKTEAAVQTKLRKEAEDLVADAMTLADRGNPWYRRKQFRQEKTVAEVATP